jgi:D-alanyl-D-alanine dipeptidase
VNDFIAWSKESGDTLMKSRYYPDFTKLELFEEGYISKRSGHSRGSTIDLTLVYGATGLTLDMGGPYDFFGKRSHHSFRDVTEEQRANRLHLKRVMESNGFSSYSKEWWHYTLIDEPFPDTYFDFPVR